MRHSWRKLQFAMPHASGRLPRMPRVTLLLSVLLNLSILLMPFDLAHAHVGSTNQSSAEVHIGHAHDFDHGSNEHRSDESIIDLTDAHIFQPRKNSTLWSDWLPLACVILLTAGVAQLYFLLPIAHRTDPALSSSHGYWRPPLRGPPAFSIR
jgi:hypothetical protein